MSRSVVAARLATFAGTVASLCCGGQRAPATSAPVDASVDGGPSILWSYGQGADISDVVQSRSGTLYVAMSLHGDAGVPGAIGTSTPAVAAIEPLGHERWRVIVPDRSVYMVICNGSGDVWAFGTGVTRISSSGAVVWHLDSQPGTGSAAHRRRNDPGRSHRQDRVERSRAQCRVGDPRARRRLRNSRRPARRRSCSDGHGPRSRGLAHGGP